VQRAILSSAAALTALALVASPAAAPVRHAASPVTLKTVRLATSWRQSHFVSGRLILAGKATQAMTLNVGWFAKSLLNLKKPRYGKSGPLTGHVKVKGGKFRKTIKFRTALFPGAFVVMGYAKGASGVTSFKGRVVKLAGPPEGIVIKAKGRASGRAGVFASFTFAPSARPKARRVTTTWFYPTGRALRGTVPAAQIVNTNVEARGRPLPVGFWRCQLSSAGRLIAEVSVRVG